MVISTEKKLIVRRADRVREQLEHMIAVGDFTDGERLNEANLTEKFEVSRTPLREAFQTLAASGLVELVPNRGAFVRYPKFEELVEMFEFMAELEVLCVKRAARRITIDQLQRLTKAEDACAEAVQADDREAYYRENGTFHHVIYEASGNAFLHSETSRLYKRLAPFRRLQLLVKGRLDQSLQQHRAIVKALEDGNEELTGQLLFEHVAVQGEKFHDLMTGYRKRQHNPLSELSSSMTM